MTIPLSLEELLLIISILRSILPPEQVATSAAGSILVEACKSILSRFKKPLPSLTKAELESLVDDIKEEAERKDQDLANSMNEAKMGIICYLETTMEKGNEAILDEIKKNALLEQEILEMLKRLEEASQSERISERLSRPWTESPRKITNYISREEREGAIAEKIKGNENIICIEGLPGSGKTSLLAHVYEKEKSGKAFWCQIRKGDTSDTVLEALARFFSFHEIENIKRHFLRPERNYEDVYDDLTRNLTKHEFLFFLDNYHLLRDEQFDVFLERLLELDLKSRVILATRETILPQSVRHQVGTVTLQGFTQEEVKEFLQKNKINVRDECFHMLCRRTGRMPMLILLVVQKLREIKEEYYCDFISSLPNKDIEKYLMETIHEGLNPDERIVLQILSALCVPESVKRISRFYPSIDAENALDGLESRFLVIRDFLDNYSSHEIIWDFYRTYMEKKCSGFLCELDMKAYEMYCEDFEAGDVEAGALAVECAERILSICDMETARELNYYIPILRNRVANGFLQVYRPLAAIKILNAALEEDRKERDLRREAIDLNTLGNAYLVMNRNSSAIQSVEKALEIDKEIGDKRSQAIDMNLLGKAMLESNDLKKAREYLEKALEIDKEIGDKRQQAIDMNLLGKVSRELNQPAEAIQYYEGALRISKEIESIKNISYNLLSLGSTYFSRDNYAEAENYFEECIKIPFEINRVAWKKSFERLGDIYKYRGENEKALEYYRKALELHKGRNNELKMKISQLEQSRGW